MNDNNVILQVSPGLPPYLNPAALAEDLYPGVAISVKTDFKNGSYTVDSFILCSSSVSIKKEGIRRLTIGLESLPGTLGDSTVVGFVVNINDHYVVEEINSDTDVDVVGIKIRLFGPNPALRFLEGTEKG